MSLSGLEDLNHSVEGGISSDEIEGDEHRGPARPLADGRVKPSSFESALAVPARLLPSF